MGQHIDFGYFAPMFRRERPESKRDVPISRLLAYFLSPCLMSVPFRG